MVARRTALVFGIAATTAMASVVSCDYKPRNQGRVLYESECQSCHMENGQGLGELMPPLANADYVKENTEALACIIRYGMEGPVVVNGVEYNGQMPGNRQLSEIEIANLIHYLLEVLNEQENTMTINEVREQLKGCKKP